MSDDSFDNLAELESLAMSRGSLEDEANRNAGIRKEEFKGHIHNAAILLFWAAIAVVMTMSISWAWHLLAPEKWYYLSPSNIQKIETILFSGALASVIPVFAKKYI